MERGSGTRPDPSSGVTAMNTTVVEGDDVFHRGTRSAVVEMAALEREESLPPSFSSSSPLPRPVLVEAWPSLNRTLLDPAQWGWTAAGGVADLLTPHERARRKSTRKEYLKNNKKRKREQSRAATGAAPLKPPPPGGDNGRDPTSFYHPAAAAKLTPPTPPTAGRGRRKGPAKHRAAAAAGTGKKPAAATNITRVRSQALSSDGTQLDVLTYHRGREGEEARNEETGELLGDVEATDTHFGVDEPKLTLPVVIRFPLDAPHLELADGSQEASSGPAVHYFQDTVLWKLLDTSMPTPMEYAASISQQFGLSWTETLDLAESIQDQLRDLVVEQCSYTPLMALHAILAPNPEKIEAPNLYGEVTGWGPGGWPMTSSTASSATGKTPAKAAGRTSSMASSVMARQSSMDARGSITKNPGNSESGKSLGKRRRETKGAGSLVPPVLEPIYKEQALVRLLRASQSDAARHVSLHQEPPPPILEPDSIPPLAGSGLIITTKNDCYCHTCHFHRQRGGQLWCGVPRHSYCDIHVREHFGDPPTDMAATESLAEEKEAPPCIDHCPICALSCPCPTCADLVDLVAAELKKRATEQGQSAEDASFDDILEFRNSLHQKPTAKSSLSTKEKTGRKKKRKLDDMGARLVPKVPPLEFPREIYNGVDLDPGTDIDYSTVFTENGSFVSSKPSAPRETVNETVSSDSTLFVEDGNVDYCTICKKVGNLVCCDHCPRAFHAHCLPEADQMKLNKPPSDTRRNKAAALSPEAGQIEQNESTTETGLVEQNEALWECPRCKAEKAGLKDDKIEGKKSLPKISTAFSDVKLDDRPQNLSFLNTMSLILTMINNLLSYDFGYMFKEPVDLEQFPTYSNLVKEPMDLGTVASRIVNGYYRDRYIQGADMAKNLDDIILAALKDIELVWHNCFLFNREGSAVYRMAGVQRMRALRIRKASFDDLLSERIKSELDEYVQLCAADRSKYGRIDRVVPCPHVKSRHKIAATGTGSNGRPLAVLDPDSGMIVKIYTTMQAVLAVVKLFHGLKHPCEWTLEQIDTGNKLRNLIVESHRQPSLLVFGYRWVFLDELKAGRVAFAHRPSKRQEIGESAKSTGGPTPALPAPSKEKKGSVKAANPAVTIILEMVQNETICWFYSIDELLTNNALDNVRSAGQLDILSDAVIHLPVGGNYIELFGRKWRRLSPSLATKPATFLAHLERETCTSRIMFYKEEIVGGKLRMGFTTIMAAYGDWVHCLSRTSSAALGLPLEAWSVDSFISLYLQGEGSWCGQRWRSVGDKSLRIRPPAASQPSTATHPTSASPDLPLNHNTRVASSPARVLLPAKDGTSVANLANGKQGTALAQAG